MYANFTIPKNRQCRFSLYGFGAKNRLGAVAKQPFVIMAYNFTRLYKGIDIVDEQRLVHGTIGYSFHSHCSCLGHCCLLTLSSAQPKALNNASRRQL